MAFARVADVPITACRNACRVILATYNICIGANNQRPDTVDRLGIQHRLNDIYSTIEQTNADIIAIQELRAIDEFMCATFIAAMETRGYRAVVLPNNATAMCFSSCVLYRPGKVFPDRIEYNWIAPNPSEPSDFPADQQISDGFGRLLPCIRFRPVVTDILFTGPPRSTILTDGPGLWVLPVHFGLKLPAKLEAVELIFKLLRKLTTFYDGAVVMGDMNIFADEPDGLVPREKLCETLDWLSENAIDTLTGEVATHTFRPYTSERDYGRLASLPTGILDHIFGQGCVVSQPPVVLRTVRDGYLSSQPDSTPSDHYPVVVGVTWGKSDLDEVDTMVAMTE